MPKVYLIHGPNFTQLGTRQPEIYGTTTLAEVEEQCKKAAADLGVQIEAFQGDFEGDLVEVVHQARNEADAIVINAGALTHYGWSLADALAMFNGPIIEIHISNPDARESWRHTSVITPKATGTIAGLGIIGYALALQAVAFKLS